MKFTNTTDYPDYFLRRVLSFCMKETGLKKKQLTEIHFGTKSRGLFKGTAWYSEVRIMINRHAHTWKLYRPYMRRGVPNWYETPEQCLVMLVAHELRHVRDQQDGSMNRRGRGGRRVNVELRAEHSGRSALVSFLKREEELLAEWNKPPKRKAAKPEVSLQEKRAANILALLDKWERKAKAAQKKVKAYRAKARYYERALAKRSDK